MRALLDGEHGRERVDAGLRRGYVHLVRCTYMQDVSPTLQPYIPAKIVVRQQDAPPQDYLSRKKGK